MQNYDKPTQNLSDWDCYVTNPTTALLPRGEVMLVFSSVPCAGGFEEALGVAFAPHWNATYMEDPTAVWRKSGPRNVKTPRQGVGNVEGALVLDPPVSRGTSYCMPCGPYLYCCMSAVFSWGSHKL